jgi:effector-binding domain-containing protein
MLEATQYLTLPAQPVAAIQLRIPRSEIQHVMGPGIQEVYGALGAQGIAPAGPWMTHHFRMAPDVFDFEICVPVAQAVAPTGRVKPGVLAPCKVARTQYRGPYEGLGQAWGEFRARLGKDGQNIAEALREAYLVGPETTGNSAEFVTELTQELA